MIKTRRTTLSETVITPVTENLSFYVDSKTSQSFPGRGSTWFDLSGNNLNGSISEPFIFDTSEKVFVSTHFTGQVNFASNANFSVGTGNFTIESWFLADGFPDSFNPILVVETVGGLWFGKLDNNQLGLRAYSVANFISTPLPSLNVWHHLLITRNGNTCSLYLNGVLMTTATVTQNFTQANAIVGSDGGGARWKGRISTVKLYKGKGFTSSEVLQNYDATKTKYGHN